MRGGIARSQAGEFIPANDPLFDQYIAMSYDDFRDFYKKYVLGCKEWYPNVPMMGISEGVKIVAPILKEK